MDTLLRILRQTLLKFLKQIKKLLISFANSVRNTVTRLSMRQHILSCASSTTPCILPKTKRMAIGRPQELNSKYDELHREGKHIHLIGHLQTNKVKQVVGRVEMIQSVDSLRVARAISEKSRDLGIVTNALVEVNIGNEENKSGVSAAEAYELICQISEFDGINVQGLMAIPPADCEIAQTIRYFDEIYKLFIDIGAKNTHNSSYTMKHLSMGMSADYAEAIRHGSTMVRVGTALFGRRNYNK